MALWPLVLACVMQARLVPPAYAAGDVPRQLGRESRALQPASSRGRFDQGASTGARCAGGRARRGAQPADGAETDPHQHGSLCERPLRRKDPRTAPDWRADSPSPTGGARLAADGPLLARRGRAPARSPRSPGHARGVDLGALATFRLRAPAQGTAALRHCAVLRGRGECRWKTTSLRSYRSDPTSLRSSALVVELARAREHAAGLNGNSSAGTRGMDHSRCGPPIQPSHRRSPSNARATPTAPPAPGRPRWRAPPPQRRSSRRQPSPRGYLPGPARRPLRDSSRARSGERPGSGDCEDCRNDPPAGSRRPGAPEHTVGKPIVREMPIARPEQQLQLVVVSHETSAFFQPWSSGRKRSLALATRALRVPSGQPSSCAASSCVRSRP